MEVSESTLPTNKDTWYSWECVCAIHRAEGSGVLPQLFTGYIILPHSHL